MQTSFLKIICQYLYLENNEQQRLPHNLQENLGCQEFKMVIQNLLDAVDVVFNEDIDWSILLQAFEALKQEYPAHNIRLRGVEANSNYRFIVKIKIYPHEDIEAMVKYFGDRYQFLALTKNNSTPVKKAKPQANSEQEKVNLYEQN